MEWIDIGIETTWNNALLLAIKHGGFIPSMEQAKEIKEKFDFWTCETRGNDESLAVTSRSVMPKTALVRVIIVKKQCPTLKVNIYYATGDAHNK